MTGAYRKLNHEKGRMFMNITFDEIINGDLCEMSQSIRSELEHRSYLIDPDNGADYGTIGDQADFTDIYDNPLFIGDVVDLYHKREGRSCGLQYICYLSKYGYFVMSVAVVNFYNGISNAFEIRKVKSYKDIRDGEEYGGATAVIKG